MDSKRVKKVSREAAAKFIDGDYSKAVELYETLAEYILK